ncbi:unnamed protein product [Pleuronectes platessa]|uniref:Uncharacterized protein n=1 Tax=Pleuronectes platessa TaxID=8262 RepID=A0A9N7TJZ8_PLEPL|nr:unnamed protein product [Pleuronectes platessa]
MEEEGGGRMEGGGRKEDGGGGRMEEETQRDVFKLRLNQEESRAAELICDRPWEEIRSADDGWLLLQNNLCLEKEEEITSGKSLEGPEGGAAR